MRNNDPETLEEAAQLFMMAPLLSMQGQHEKALELYQKAYSFLPDNVDLLVGWGSVLVHLERYAEACEKYEQAAQLQPDDVLLLLGWANALTKLGRYEEACNKYAKAAPLQPANVLLLVNWGLALAGWGRYEEASEKYKQGHHLHPEDPDILVNWGISLFHSGQLADALEKFQQATHLRPDHGDTLVFWGHTLRELKQYEDACAKYARATQLQPENASTWHHWGRALQLAGQYEEACEKFQQAYQLQPDETGTLFQWGETLRRLGREDEAQEKLAQAEELMRRKRWEASVPVHEERVRITNCPKCSGTHIYELKVKSMHVQRRLILLDPQILGNIRSDHDRTVAALKEMGIPDRSITNAILHLPFLVSASPMQKERFTRHFTCPISGAEFQAWFELRLLPDSPILAAEVAGSAAEDEDLGSDETIELGHIDSAPVILPGHILAEEERENSVKEH